MAFSNTPRTSQHYVERTRTVEYAIFGMKLCIYIWDDMGLSHNVELYDTTRFIDDRISLTNGCMSLERMQLLPSKAKGGEQVVAGICPFNFPAMVPLWMWPVAVTAGNTFVLKPSEQDPGCAVLLAELAQQAGLPPGVLNIGVCPALLPMHPLPSPHPTPSFLTSPSSRFLLFIPVLPSVDPSHFPSSLTSSPSLLSAAAWPGA